MVGEEKSGAQVQKMEISGLLQMPHGHDRDNHRMFFVNLTRILLVFYQDITFFYFPESSHLTGIVDRSNEHDRRCGLLWLICPGE